MPPPSEMSMESTMSLLCGSLRRTIPQRKEAAIPRAEWSVSNSFPPVYLLNHFSDTVGQHSLRQWLP